jgi:class 3 adenylate cyclase/tetratricopeptide (TPR) repeat protein
MHCPSCGHENPPGSSFCLECGRPYTSRCVRCDAELPAAAKFCNSCGNAQGPAVSRAAPEPRSYTPKHLAEKILSSRSAIEGERKQVTVLFADLKGSMELSEAIDPEDYHKIMERFFRILTDGVHRFEGTVNQYTGDGIMALFGAPIAHEDHAARACYATLSLQEELRRYANELRIEKGISFSVRMGLNSGDVVVGKIGDDLRMDYTALGHTASLGARMEQIASPDRTYLTEHTAKLVEGLVALQDLGKHSIKGVKEPLRVYELQGIGRLKTHLEVSRARGFSKFVGRSGEMAVLEGALERALHCSGQVVGIVADPGVGTSRLCFEFVERCRARGGIFVDEGHCLAHGKTIPYVPILELWRSYFRITEKDSNEEARRKIAGTLLLLAPGLHESLPVVFEFLGVTDPERPVPQMDPEAKQRRLFALLRDVIQLQTERQPLILLIDDLHWIDRASDGWVAQLAELTNGRRFLLLLNFRPEYDASWMKRSWYQQLPLLPLGREAVEELLAGLLGTDPSLAKLGHRIRERTGGNPFFIEEVVQSLAESGSLEGTKGRYRLARPIETIDIPTTVQAVLAARIDRLPEREKRLLQAAAVIGKVFPESILKRIAEIPDTELVASLAALERGELVFAETLYPEAEYAFKHPLTQEVAYRSQLAERRLRVHAAVARAIEELAGDKLDERAALLAHHCENAGEPLKAALWHGRAGDWAGLNAADDAFRHWTRVLTLLEGISQSAETIELALEARARILTFSWSHGGLSAEQSAAMLQEGRDLGARTGGETALAKMLLSYGTARYVAAGSPIESLGPLEDSVPLADRAGDLGLRIATRFALYQNYFLLGRIPAALDLNATAVELAGTDLTLPQRFLGFTMSWVGYGVRGWILSEAGRLGEAAEALDRSRDIARRFGETVILSWTNTMGTLLCERSGDAPAALRHAREAMELAERTGNSLAGVAGHYASGIALLMNGSADEAAKSLGLAIRSIRDTGTSGMFEADAIAVLACAELAQGDANRARETATAALEMGRRRGMRLAECRALFALAASIRTLRGAEAHAEVEGILDEAAALVRDTGARAREPLIRLERAELARLVGDDARRRSELREAHRLFSEMGATGHAERLAKELAP